jgi:hypothetical protein
MTERRWWRSARGVAVLVGAGLIVAACSSSPAPRTTAKSTTTTSGHHAGTTTTAPAATTTTTLPTSGPLTAQAPIAIPLATTQVVAAEGPDGAVFVAAQAPNDPSPCVVYVVDGNGPAAIAEHLSSGVAALAADANNLYVATYKTVTAFSRSSGNEVQQWPLPDIQTANSSDADLVSMVAASGRVFVLVADGNTVNVLTIYPASSAAPVTVAQATGPAAVGPDGTIYYEAGTQRITSLSAANKTTSGIALQNQPNGLGGGVQYIDTVAGGYVWVTEPAGQGEDQGWTTFNATTLQQVGTFGGNIGQTVVNTAAGPLVLSTADATSACSQQGESGVGCVSRISAQGTLTAPVEANNGIALVGPDPVIIEGDSGFTALSLIRLT